MNIVQKFYDENAEYEWNRLERHRMEFEVTMLALEEYLPSHTIKILDIGGGPGRYSIALAKKGHEITLLDMSKKCLDFAKDKASEAGVELADYRHSNALDLSQIERQSYDAILLMGPLYHLLTIEERQKALQEAINALKPNGHIFATFITRYAQLLYAAGNEPMWIAKHPDRAEVLLSTGILKCQGSSFTDAYCAHPSEIIPFMETAGLKTLDLIGCEGITIMAEEKLNEFEPDLWNAWVKMNYRLGKNSSLHGAATHLLYVGRKI